MTAPVFPTAPAAPAAPAAPDVKALQFDPSAAMEATIGETLKTVNEPPPPILPPRDEKGKFLKKEEAAPPEGDASGEAPAAPAPDAGQDGAQAAPPPSEGTEVQPEAEPEIPEGFVAAPTLPEDRTKGFRVRDKEGEILAPDLVWEFNAGGQLRSLSTDKLISYAQLGVYNHEREQREQSTRAQLTQTQQELMTLRQRAEQAELRYETVMASDDNYVNERTKYDMENTPERRLDRERQLRRYAEESATIAHVAAAGQQFYAGTIAPAVDTIVKALPTVSNDEVAMRLFMLTEHLRVPTSRGEMLYPMTAYDQMKSVLINDVVPWAQQVHESRHLAARKPTQDAQAQTQKAKKEVEAAQIRAQKARKAVASATRPAAPQSAGGRPPTPTVRTGKDAEAAVIDSTLAAIRAG